MKIDFEKGGGIAPAIIQDARDNRVLMLGYMNQEALDKTLLEGRVTFYSRSKKRLWTKGESSKNYLEVDKIVADCDQDAILIRVVPQGAVCHTGNRGCFRLPIFSLYTLEEIIADRAQQGSESSYTAKLLEAGLARTAQKVGEEAAEVIIAALNEPSEGLVEEAADLVYHLMVLMRRRGLRLRDVESVLSRRNSGGITGAGCL